MFYFVLEGLLFELRWEQTSPDKLNDAALAGTKGRDNGKTGVLLWKQIIWTWWKRLLRNTAISASEGLQKDITELISKFDSWQTFADSFMKKDVAESEATELGNFEKWKT